MKCRFMRPIAISRRFRVTASNFGLWAHFPAPVSVLQKSRSQRGLRRAGAAAERVEVTLSRTGNSGGIGFQSQRFELAATPIGVQVSQAFDDEAARQSTLYRCPDQLGREKGKGECQIDLTRRTSLALGQLLGAGYRAINDFI